MCRALARTIPLYCTLILLRSLLYITEGVGAQEQLTCIACDTDSYLNPAGVCQACPENSFTDTAFNASSVNDCLCGSGYTNSSAVACEACALNTFKSTLGNVSCTECPVNSVTLDTGSVYVEDCYCDKGLHLSGTNEECVACEAGKYKAHVANLTAEVPQEAACEQCPANFYGPIQTIDPIACPADSTSLPGAQDIYACHCGIDFFALVMELIVPNSDPIIELTCQPCPPELTTTKQINCSVNPVPWILSIPQQALQMSVRVSRALRMRPRLQAPRQLQTAIVELDFPGTRATSVWRAHLDFTVPTCQSIFALPVPSIPTMSWMLAQMWQRACHAQQTQPAQPDLESKLTVCVIPDCMPLQQQIVAPGSAPHVRQAHILQPQTAPVVRPAPQVHILKPQVPPPPKHACNAKMVHTHYQPVQSNAPVARTLHGKTVIRKCLHQRGMLPLPQQFLPWNQWKCECG
jgi:hypothetical protein